MIDRTAGIGRLRGIGTVARRSRIILAGALAVLLLAAATTMLTAASAGKAASDLDWTIGVWEGVRRDGADGTEDPMTMRVEAILSGTGQIRQIEIPHGKGVYRGFAVQVFNEEKGRWLRHYTNQGRGRFSSLEGEVAGDVSTWYVTSPDRTRESRLVSERLDGDRWRRTMSISKDGGRSWTVLWTDELRRAEGSGESG